MMLEKEKHPDAARATLKFAIKAAEANVPKPGGDELIAIDEWVLYETLRKEAITDFAKDDAAEPPPSTRPVYVNQLFETGVTVTTQPAQE